MSIAVVVLAIVGSLPLAAAPVQADVDPCLPQFEVTVGSEDQRWRSEEVIIGPAGALSGGQYTRGWAFDPCPGDGIFDNALRFRYLGRVWLKDGTSYEVTDFTAVPYSSTVNATAIFLGWTHVPYDRHSALGRADFGVWVTDGNGHWLYATTSFSVRRDVKMTFNAGPEPVKKGATINVSGTVTRLTFNAAGVPTYVPYNNKTVDIYWNPRGPRGERHLAALKTNARGAYSTNFSASVDAAWYGRSNPSPYHAVPLYGPKDFVDVQ